MINGTRRRSKAVQRILAAEAALAASKGVDTSDRHAMHAFRRNREALMWQGITCRARCRCDGTRHVLVTGMEI